MNRPSLSNVKLEVARADLTYVAVFVDLFKAGVITQEKAEEITGKSPTTAWRYLKILVDAGVVESEGGTNNLVYKLTDEYRK